MDEVAIPGQGRAAATRLLARAARALEDDGALGTEELLACYRAAAPSAHPGCTRDVIDAGFIARARALGGDALLGARGLRVVSSPWRMPWRCSSEADRVVELRAPPSAARAGDALALFVGLALESAKLAHGLLPVADELRAAFPSPAAAQASLAALHAGGAARVLELAADADRVDRASLSALIGDRPCYVVTGDGGARVHDLLSPFARRLREPLGALGAKTGPSSARDDVVYAGITALLAAEPDVLGERLLAERSDGVVPLGPGALAVRCEALADIEVDRRCRNAATQLKRGRALLVLVEPSRRALDEVLGTLGLATRAVAVLTLGTRAITPGALRDAATAHVTLVDNALPDAAGTLQSLPSLALGAEETDGADDDAKDAGAFALVQSVLAARAKGTLDARARLAVRCVLAQDHAAMSSACLDLLGRLVPPAPGRARGR